jgi:hypothetical protein
MKRLVLCTLAVLLTSGALISSRPAFACTADPQCDDFECYDSCVQQGFHNGTCNWCTGACRCS